MNKYEKELMNFQWNCQVESVHLKELVKRATPIYGLQNLGDSYSYVLCQECGEKTLVYKSAVKFCSNCGQAFKYIWDTNSNLEEAV